MFRFSIFCLAMVLAGPPCLPADTAGPPPSTTAGESAALEMAEAALAFLGSLDKEQQARARVAFDNPERENWNFIPKQRAGLPWGELRTHQQPLAMALLASGLSQRGMLKATTIMSLEQVLAEIENAPERRDPGKYHFTIFGDPGARQPWAWRLEGHHLSIQFTLAPGGKISSTPSFFGSNPAEVKDGARRGLRPLAGEEEKARALAAILSAAGHPGVIFSERAPAEILTGADRQTRQLEPVGVEASALTEAQQSVLRELIHEYLGRHRGEVAAADWKRIEAAGFGKIRFGWAGATAPGKAYYYRVQGPTFLIECANSQNNANHIHSVWRDFNGDFGRDTLAEHYRHGHDHEH